MRHSPKEPEEAAKERRSEKGLPVLWGIYIFNEHNAITNKNANWTPFKEGSVTSLWLFHLHSMVKIQPFLQFFPLADFMAEVFCCSFP